MEHQGSASAIRVFIIDDDVELARSVATNLKARGYDVHTAATPAEALAYIEDQTSDPDVILLDVAMPQYSGWEVLPMLRERGCQSPVIYVSAHGHVDQRVRGLSLGADDYLVKPFETIELIARIEAVLRRANLLPVLHVRDLAIDLGRRTVERGQRRIDLSPREFEVLHALVEANGEPVSREDLLQKIWGIGFDPGTSVVEVQINRLRRKLDRNGPPLIETVTGKGYCIRRESS